MAVKIRPAGSIARRAHGDLFPGFRLGTRWLFNYFFPLSTVFKFSSDLTKPQAIGLVGRRLEEHFELLQNFARQNSIEVVLAIAARLDHSGHTQQSQMVAHRGLALAEQFAESANI